jgi:hypothetical protein
MWFELMEYAKTAKKPMVFVTDDAKNDWWLEVSGLVVGPLPHLVQEFVRTTGQPILLYRPDRFAEHASTHLNSDLDPGVVDEIRLKTEQQRLRRKRQPSSGDKLDDFMGIVAHLTIHDSDARELIDAVHRFAPTRWQLVRSPFEVPPELRDAIQKPLLNCQCLLPTLENIKEFDRETYENCFREASRQMHPTELSRMKSFRDIAPGALDFIRTLRSAPPRA